MCSDLNLSKQCSIQRLGFEGLLPLLTMTVLVLMLTTIVLL